MNVAQHSFITDEQAEKALDFLRDSAAEIGEAKAEVIRTAFKVKAVEALMFLSSEGPVEQRKAKARNSVEYEEAALAEAKAAGAYEALRSLREAAGAKIEAWRSASANYRAMKI